MVTKKSISKVKRKRVTVLEDVKGAPQKKKEGAEKNAASPLVHKEEAVSSRKQFTPLESRHRKAVVTNKKINGESGGQSRRHSALLTGFIAKSKKKKYYEAVGRRKTSVARVRLETTNPLESAESGNFIVNGKKHTFYFFTPELREISEAALRKIKSLNRFMVSVKVKGGGTTSQAEAVRHGIARALVRFDVNFRKKLKKSGYLTRDPRMRERKKYGLKRARRAPQWVKR